MLLENHQRLTGHTAGLWWDICEARAPQAPGGQESKMSPFLTIEITKAQTGTPISKFDQIPKKKNQKNMFNT